MKKRLSFKELEQRIQSLFPEADYLSYLHSTFWKNEKKKELNLLYSISSKTSIFASYRAFIVVMDYDLKIIRVKHLLSENEKSKKGQSLIGEHLDSTSMKYYELKVSDHFSGLSGSVRVGHLVNNNFKPLTKKFFTNFKVETEYEGNGELMSKYGSIEYAEVFKKICSTYRKELISFELTDENGSTYSALFKIKGKEVNVQLSQFFNYTLAIRVSGKNKSVKFSSKNTEATEMMTVLSDLLSNKKTTRLKAIELGSYLYKYKRQSIVVINKNEAKLIVTFGENGPRGSFTFDLNFRNKTVSCNQSKSKVFIPKKVAELKEALNVI